MQEQHAYTIDQFCDAHGIGRTLCYAEIAAGRLQAKKAGRRTLILADDARKWREQLPDGRDAA